MLKAKPILEGKSCGHSNCREVCHVVSNKKAPQPLKRTALKRSTTPIRKVSLTNKKAESNSESWTNLRDDLDAIFSLYIRHKYAYSDGTVSCYTCGAVKPIAFMQNGHFISRSHLSTRWDENNCRPQDYYCNELLDGNLKIFAKRLEAELKGAVEHLNELSREVVSLSVSDLRELLEEYKHKLKIAKLKFK